MKQLGEERIGKLLLTFSLPAIVGMLVNAMYSVLDRVFVGHMKVGASLALSGITISYPIMIIIMAFGMLVGIGAAALVSIELGKKNKEKAEIILGHALVLVVVLSVALSLIGIAFLEPLLKKLGASEEVLPYAMTFSKIMLAGAVLQNVGFGLNNIIRAEGNPPKAMKTMLIGAGINVILNPIFIYIFNLGVAGSALATIFSQTVCSVWILHYFTKGNSSLKLRRKNLKLQKEIILEIFAIGMSPFAMQVAASVVTILLNAQLDKHGGDAAIAAYGLINSFAMLVMMPIFGINQGAQPIIGYNHGAGKPHRAKRTLVLAIVAATIIVVIGFLLVEIFPTQIIQVFNSDDADLLKMGSHGIRIYLFMLPIIGFQVVSSNYFQAIGKAKVSIFLSLSRQVIMLIPLIIILPSIYGLDGVWFAAPISDFLSSLLTGVFLFFEMRRVNNLSVKETHSCKS